MFTGIIQSVGKLRQEKNILEIEILDNLFDMAIGDSIAVDGICLTVKEIFQNKFTVDVSEETLKKTTLGGCIIQKISETVVVLPFVPVIQIFFVLE